MYKGLLAVGTPISKRIDTYPLHFGDLTTGRFGPVGERSDNLHPPLIRVDFGINVLHPHRGRDDAVF